MLINLIMLIHNMFLEFTLLTLLPYLPDANVLTLPHDTLSDALFPQDQHAFKMSHVPVAMKTLIFGVGHEYLTHNFSRQYD